MKIDVAAVRACLKAFDFTTLFREHLGWDNHEGQLEVPVGLPASRLSAGDAPADGQAGGGTVRLEAIAQKRGFVAYLCECGKESGTAVPAVKQESSTAVPAVNEKTKTTSGTPVPLSSPGIPDRATRLKIDHQVTKSAREHLVIYADRAAGQQVWQWVRREPGKPLASRDHRFDVAKSGDPLIQRLDQLAVSMDEEEAITVVDVAGRARAAFDVDKVTKKFYDRFKTEHAAFLKLITGIGSDADLQWYTSLMLNRLMFVYFIQKKGFLDGDTDYLRNRLAMVQEEWRRRPACEDGSRDGRPTFFTFYRYFLLRLFHDGLGKSPAERDLDPAMERLLGRVPFLNGGFFEVHQLEERNAAIDIPDKAFQKLFDFFDQYRWHLDERPLRADNEINPDVVGYIFEKYINQKQMGAYYTKEDITEYISKNTIIPFLFDAAARKCPVAFEPGRESGTGVSPVGQASSPESGTGVSPVGQASSPESGTGVSPVVWDLLRQDPDRYIYPAVRHGVVDEQGNVIPLPEEIAAGIDDVAARGGWNRPAADPYALPTETWREHVARRQRCLDLRARLKSGTGDPPVLPQNQSFIPFSPDDDLSISRRNLPHWEQAGRTYFVTFRLADALPAAKLAQWRAERDAWLATHPEPWSEADVAEYTKLFPERLQAWLDAGSGECHLRRPQVSAIVEGALRHFDGNRYALDVYAVMPNHVHVLVKPLDDCDLSEILHSWKSFTSHEINRLLGRKGTFWQDESFDHIVRSERQLDFYRQYIEENPAKARLRDGESRCGSGIGVGGGESGTAVSAVNQEEKTTGETPVPLSAPLSQPISSINDLITLNLDIWQFARDAIVNAEGPELLRAFWHAIEKVTVLDPTCGSGAFLFAALRILETLYSDCLERMRQFVDEEDVKSGTESGTAVSAVSAGQKTTGGTPVPLSVPRLKYPDFRAILAQIAKHPNERYFVLKSIIINNLFGVDIMEEAVEICKLRLFLKLVAQVEAVEQIEPLPDIDFNIRAGNTLVGFASLAQVKESMQGDMIKLLELPRIEESAELVERAFRQFRAQQTTHGGKVTHEDKLELRSRLAALDAELDRYLASEYGIPVETGKKSGTAVPAVKPESSKAVPAVNEKTKTTGGTPVPLSVPLSDAFAKWKSSHEPFHWCVEFYGIMNAGGFDVIIGNPPYVSAAKVRKSYNVKHYATEKCPDIYAWCLERVSCLTQAGAHAGMIVPLSLGFSGDFGPLRSMLYDAYRTNWFSSFGRIPSALFAHDVRVRNTIHLGARRGAGRNYTTRLHRWFDAEREGLLSLMSYAHFDPGCWSGRIPKLNTQALIDAFQRAATRDRCIQAVIAPRHTKHRLLFKKTAYNWLNFCRELPPCYDERGKAIAHTQFDQLHTQTGEDLVRLFLLLNGKLQLAFWLAVGDDFHVAKWMFTDLPADLSRISGVDQRHLAELADRLEKAMKEATSFKLNAGKRVGNYNLARCRSVTDESDAVFAKVFGFGDVWEDIELLYTQCVRTDFAESDDGEED